MAAPVRMTEFDVVADGGTRLARVSSRDEERARGEIMNYAHQYAHEEGKVAVRRRSGKRWVVECIIATPGQ